jgi:hypothetical protein
VAESKGEAKRAGAAKSQRREENREGLSVAYTIRSAINQAASLEANAVANALIVDDGGVGAATQPRGREGGRMRRGVRVESFPLRLMSLEEQTIQTQRGVMLRILPVENGS